MSPRSDGKGAPVTWLLVAMWVAPNGYVQSFQEHCTSEGHGVSRFKALRNEAFGLPEVRRRSLHLYMLNDKGQVEVQTWVSDYDNSVRAPQKPVPALVRTPKILPAQTGGRPRQSSGELERIAPEVPS